MRAFFVLFKKELNVYFLSSFSYFVYAIFLFIFGYSFWLLLNELTQEHFSITADTFCSTLFWVALAIPAPLITMRLFSEEKKQGTMETLLTAPVNEINIVLAKYFSAFAFYILMWLPTLSYLFIIKRIDSSFTIDLRCVIISYFGGILISAFYLAIGLFASSLTKNQITAAFLCLAIIIATFLAGTMSYNFITPLAQNIGNYISPIVHMNNFSRGVIDTQAVAFYISSILYLLFATSKVIAFK